MAIFHCLSVIFEAIMIAFLQGNFVQLTPAKLIVDVGGVGYEVNISLNTYESISGKEKGLLHTYLHLTENSQVLFGFFGQDEKELFMQLISVSGVGASTARMRSSDSVRRNSRHRPTSVRGSPHTINNSRATWTMFMDNLSLRAWLFALF